VPQTATSAAANSKAATGLVNILHVYGDWVQKNTTGFPTSTTLSIKPY